MDFFVPVLVLLVLAAGLWFEESWVEAGFDFNLEMARRVRLRVARVRMGAIVFVRCVCSVGACGCKK